MQSKNVGLESSGTELYPRVADCSEMRKFRFSILPLPILVSPFPASLLSLAQSYEIVDGFFVIYRYGIAWSRISRWMPRNGQNSPPKWPNGREDRLLRLRHRQPLRRKHLVLFLYRRLWILTKYVFCVTLYQQGNLCLRWFAPHVNVMMFCSWNPPRAVIIIIMRRRRLFHTHARRCPY